ncbi:MAG: SIR2 family protein [Cyclobacteriaceae bacterium]
MAYQLQKNDIIILLGAGASQEAGILITSEMIEKIEEELSGSWKEYYGLYFFIKEQIEKTHEQTLNIEDLVNILDELLQLLEKKHPLTPFQLSWIEFTEKVGYTAGFVRDFRDKIISKLREWVDLKNQVDAHYYRNLALLQKSYNNPINVFTLNYDLCIEQVCRNFENKGNHIQCLIERGFGDESEHNHSWDWQRFSTSSEKKEPDIYLYKMHGSIDWERNEEQKLIHSSIMGIRKHEIIFGTRQKVRHYDPFLFFIYEFRQHILDAKLIIVCGYGFWDAHINDIIKFGLETDDNKKLLVNRYSGDDEDEVTFIKDKIDIASGSNIEVSIGPASDFFNEFFDIARLNQLFPDDESLPF